MVALPMYLFKVSISVALLFLLYYLLLRNHTFHQTNRLCLLFIILFSFTVPMCSVRLVGSGEGPTVSEVSDHYINGLNSPLLQFKSQAPEYLVSTPSVIVTVYLLGVIFLSYRFIKSTGSLYKLSRKTKVERHNRFRVRRTNSNKSFTFLNTIFLPEGETDELVLRHEQTHVAQFHWIDLLIAELAFIALWFNPVLILLRKELRLQHEFLADRSVMEKGASFEDYAQCLIRNMSSGRITHNAISPLYSNSNKKRILMMTTKKTSPYRLAIYLFMVPACALLLMSFGRQHDTAKSGTHYAIHKADRENVPDIAPVDFTKVTKVVLYGGRVDPITHQSRNHTGIDFQISAGSDVFATADGIVTTQQYDDYYGNNIIIQHDDVYSSRYAHLQTALVKKGERITKGQRIGFVGNSGRLSTIAHLHYEILKNGTKVDPKEYLPELPALN